MDLGVFVSSHLLYVQPTSADSLLQLPSLAQGLHSYLLPSQIHKHTHLSLTTNHLILLPLHRGN